jgi:hypothetical protein
MTAQEPRWRISAELCSRKQSDPTTPSPSYPLVNTSPISSSSSITSLRERDPSSPPIVQPAGTRRTKWKRHHSPSPAPSPRPRLPPRGLDPAFPSRAWPRGAPGCSRRRPRPAPSPPPARRWWSPARHRRRTAARTTPRTPRSTAPAASAAPAPRGNSRCESRRVPSFSSYVLRFIFFCAALELGFGCGSLLLEVNRCFRVSCRRMISYAACLEGTDVVRLFDRRISARRGQDSPPPSASSSCICFKDQLVDLLG